MGIQDWYYVANQILPNSQWSWRAAATLTRHSALGMRTRLQRGLLANPGLPSVLPNQRLKLAARVN